MRRKEACTGFLRRIASAPGAYNLAQWLVGERTVQRRLARHCAAIPAGSILLDMGGGTGLSSRLATGIRYLCLDLDHQKLRHFRATHIHSAAVAGDAARCPLRSETVDAVLCAKVAHHLDADQFARVLAEMGRVVKPGGAVIVADAIRSNRLVPRVLWHLDRGSHPRTDRELRAALQPLFDTPVWEEFRAGLFHDFVIFVGRRPQGKRGDLEAGI